MTILKKKKKRELFEKLTEMAKRRFDYLIHNGLSTGSGLAVKIGSQSSRISEIRNGNRQISEKMLILMVNNKVIKLGDIKDEIDLSDDEISFLEKMLK